jgi:hypothetical protein
MKANSIARRLLVLTAIPAILGCLGLGEPTGTVEGADENAQINVLFVGNSLTYTNDLPGMLAVLIESAQQGPANMVVAAYANFGLEDHWTTGGARDAISGGGWDVVVLQQGPSATEGRPSLLEYSKLFDEEVSAVSGETALYMVWPSEARFFDFEGVSESYTMAAEQIGGLLYPVGEAWRLAWESDSTLTLYGPDGFHPSEAGTYLAALVMFQQLTGLSPVGLPPDVVTPSGVVLGLSAETAAILQEAAAEANELYALP